MRYTAGFLLNHQRLSLVRFQNAFGFRLFHFRIGFLEFLFFGQLETLRPPGFSRLPEYRMICIAT